MEGLNFSSPLVLGGGAAIGLLLLVMKGKSGTANAAAQVVGANPALVSASVSMNTAALGAQVQLAGIQEKLGEAQLDANVHNQAAFYSYLENQDNNATQVRNVAATTNAGITSAIIAAGTALAIDQSNNAARTQQVRINAGATVAASANQAKIAKYQASAQKVSSIANGIGGIAKSVASIF